MRNNEEFHGDIYETREQAEKNFRLHFPKKWKIQGTGTIAFHCSQYWDE